MSERHLILRWPRRAALTGLAMALGICSSDVAAQVQPAPVALTFEAARQQLAARSDALAASRANLQANQDQADALKALGRPTVSLDAQLLTYQKSIDLSLDPAKRLVQTSIDGFLSALPSLLPDVPIDVIQQITRVIDRDVSGALAGLPGSVSFKQRDTLFHPTVTALMPLYTGGLITATQQAARAGVRQADAELNVADDADTLQLVRAYFGQQLSTQVLKVSTETRDGFQRHFADAQKLEHEGFISKAQRLRVQVARDAGQRQYLRASNEHEAAISTLSLLLRTGAPVLPQTPLFVNTATMEPLQDFVASALADQPALARLDAMREVSEQGVKIAESAWRPKVYAFGEYNLNRGDALLTEPDWIVGLGVHYPLFAGVSRRKAVSAARQRAIQADSAMSAARVEVESLTTRAWHEVETARQQFVLLQTNIEAASENLRLHDLAFREGQASAAELIDARVALSIAQTQRAAAAYEYDLALAQLLIASGRIQHYGDYIHRAEKVME